MVIFFVFPQGCHGSSLLEPVSWSVDGKVSNNWLCGFRDLLGTFKSFTVL